MVKSYINQVYFFVMKLSTQPYKGARDFYPSDKQLQDYMFGKIRQVVQSFGYQEYDAPIIEPLDLYRAKTGDEIVNEQLYSFVDRGDREVALRPEMTPTVSRMVAARRQELAYPLRWFSIPNLWRYERPQRGRLREHWQLNVDIFGEAGVAAEHEVILVADQILKSFGASSAMYEVRINSRVELNKRIAAAEPTKDITDVVRLIDALEKLEKNEFLSKLAEVVRKPGELYGFLHQDGPSESEKELLELCTKSGINALYKPSLARGFDYYTDIVFEVFDTNPENNRSMFGGGRYDGLVGLFGVAPVPTVGFGMGDVTLRNFLESHHLLPQLQTEVDIAVLLVGDVYARSQEVLSELRKAGLRVAVDATDRKIATKLNHAEKSGVSHAVFVGEDELSSGNYKIKNLHTKEEQTLSLTSLSGYMRDHLS